MVAQRCDEPVEPSRSAWRAVLWKEWRQQWPIALAMTALTGALIGAARFLWHVPFADILPWACFLWSPMVVFLGANAFGGEHDERTDVFLCALPWPPARLYVAKFGTALGLSLASLVLLAGLALWTFPAARPLGLSPDAVWFALFAGASVLALLGWTVLCASGGAGTLLTFLLTALVGGGAAVSQLLLTALLLDTLRIEPREGIAAFAGVCLCLAAAAAVGGAWLWAGRWIAGWRQLGAAAGVLLAPLGLALLLPALVLALLALLLFFNVTLLWGLYGLLFDREET